MHSESLVSPYHGETLSQQGNTSRVDQEDPDSNLVVDFDRLIEAKRELEAQKTISHDELQKRLGELKESGRLDEVYRVIFDRIQNETHYLRDFEELGLLDAIAEHALDKKKLAEVFVKWNDASIDSEGLYHGILNRASTKNKIPTKEGIILSLGLYGYLPPGLRVIGHEIVHARQNLSMKDLRSTLQSLPRKIKTQSASGEVKEIHANRDANNPPQRSSKIELVRRIQGSTDDFGDPTYEGLDLDKLIYAVQAIDQLNALGFDPQEIAKIIRPGFFSHDHGWDHNQAIYPHIQKRIDEEVNKLRLDEYDLENLVQADKLEREIEQLRVMQIVREELEK